MTGTPLRCAASTIDAAMSPLCGATISTSTPLVNMLSACSVWTASSPFATWTSSTAPTSFARCSTSRLSRCQRSSLSVSMEKPIRTGRPATAPPPAAVCSVGALMHDAAKSARSVILAMRMLILLPQAVLTPLALTGGQRVVPRQRDQAASRHLLPALRGEGRLELPLQPLVRTRPDPYLVFSGFDGPSFSGPETQIAASDGELHPPRLPGLEGDALKDLQLLQRPREARHRIADVHLHDLFALAIAGIANRRGKLQTIDAEIAVFEFRVREPEAKRIQRPDRYVEVFARVLVVRIRRSAGGKMRVVDRHLPDRPGNGHRQLGARIDIAEEHVGDRVAAFASGEPRLDDRRNVLRGPRNRQWPAG